MSHTPPQLPEKAVSGGSKARLLGQWGEMQVAEDMRRRGWTIVATNFRCRMGELDIIAENEAFLIFVEVKLRKDGRSGAPREAVTWAKQQKLRAAAQSYLIECPTTLQPRFDVAEVYAPHGIETSRPDIHYIENAF